MTVQIIPGDCRQILRTLPAESVQCCVTSPPYFGLRDYGVEGQIGLEASPADFVAEMVAVFREVHRVLRPDGTLWLNLGDTYASQGGAGWQGKNGERANRRFTATRNTVAMQEQARTAFAGHKPKDLMGIPWRVAFALQDDGWWLRQDIIWHKPNSMPESTRDRCTRSHEYIFLLSKSESYYFDNAAIAEPANYPDGNGNVRRVQPVTGERDYANGNGNIRGSLHKNGPRETRNRRSVWSITTKPFRGAHFATFPPEIPELCIKASTRPRDVVLDPFGGAGTTGLMADRLGRHAILCELNPGYVAMARDRITAADPLHAEVLA